MYLMALYGNGSWVNGYFNEKSISTRNLQRENVSVEELRKVSGAFLRRMAGVDEAYSVDEVLDNPVSETLLRLHKSITSQETADVFLQIAPGWKVRDDYNNQQQLKQVNINAVCAPAFIIAPGVKPQKSHRQSMRRCWRPPWHASSEYARPTRAHDAFVA